MAYRSASTNADNRWNEADDKCLSRADLHVFAFVSLLTSPSSKYEMSAATSEDLGLSNFGGSVFCFFAGAWTFSLPPTARLGLKNEVIILELGWYGMYTVINLYRIQCGNVM